MPPPPPGALPPAWFHILLALAEGEAHGYALMSTVAEESGGRVRLGPGTLYGALKRLLELGLVEASARRPAADEDPRRRYYLLSARGRRVLDAEAKSHARLVELARSKRILPKPRLA